MKDISELMLDRLLLQAGKIQAQELLIQKLEQQLAVVQEREATRDHPQTNEIHSKSLSDVWEERQRQIFEDGFSADLEDLYTGGGLAMAAACYAAFTKEYPEGEPCEHWPWHYTWWKPKDQRSNLVKAGALILAEIDRLDRAAAREAESQAQTAEVITEAQAVQMIAQDLEAHADELGLVATGVTNEQGQMLYCSKDEAEQHAQSAEAMAEAESLPEIPDGFIRHDGVLRPVSHNTK